MGLAAALGGCGKRGPLEPPPGVPDVVAQAKSETQIVAPSLLRSTGLKRDGADPVNKPRPARPQPFVLDPLL